jgi:DNA repair protein RecN (Recombination protein N)
MLVSLKIKNFIIIESLFVNFSKDFTVITGETGAGKSILVNAIKLVLGGRASTDLIRKGETETEIEAVFNVKNNAFIKTLLKENSMTSDDDLIVRRILNESGQNRIFINDSNATLALLSRITPYLVDICSQFENQSLFSSQYQLSLVDRFSNNENLVLEFKEIYKDIQNIKYQLKDLSSLAQERETKLEYLKFQFDEIKALDLVENEDQELKNELDQMDSVKNILELTDYAEVVFYGEHGSMISQLEALKAKSLKIKTLGFQEQQVTINKILELVEGLSSDFDKLKKSSKFNPKRRDEIHFRLESLNKIKRKFGGSIESALKKLNELSADIENLENLESKQKELTKKKDQLFVQAKEIGSVLSKKRTKAAKDISLKITKELQDLNMKGSQLEIEITHNLEEINPSGFDVININFAPNKGEPFGLLEKIASGGELSRITLAIRKVLTDSLDKTYIFDEVDTGLGGDAGKVVGRKLKEISKNNQIVCITHLAQVAIFGDKHCVLAKEEKKNRVATTLHEIITQKDRIEEIARMLGGDKSEKAALTHAEVLLRES